MKRLPPCLLLGYRTGIVILAMSASACVSSSDIDSLRTQLAGMEHQLLQLQKQGASQTGIEELRAALSEQIREVTKALDTLQGSTDSLASQIRDLEAQLEDANLRLSRLEQQMEVTNQELQDFRSARETQIRPPPPAPKPRVDPENPQAIYDAAYSDYQGGNYDLAILGFLKYLDAQPNGTQADNATYWMGECYYRKRKFQQAIDQFDHVLDRYADSDRIPSALLRKGYAFLELGQRNRGIVQLQRVVCEHDTTDEAQLARQRLGDLGIDADC